MKPKTKYKTILFIVAMLSILYGCGSVYSEHPLPKEQPVTKSLPTYFKGEYEYMWVMEGNNLFENKYPIKLIKGYLNIEINNSVCTIKQYYGFQKSKKLQINAHRDFKVENDILFYRNDSIKNRILKLSNKIVPLTENEKHELENLLENEKKGELEQNFPLAEKRGKYIFDVKTAYKIDLLHNDLSIYSTNKPVTMKIAFKQTENYMFFNLEEKNEGWTSVIVHHEQNTLAFSIINAKNIENNLSYYNSIMNVIKEKDNDRDFWISPSQANLLSFLKEPKFLTPIALLKKTSVPFYKKPWLQYTGTALILLAILLWLVVTIQKKKIM